MGLFRAMISDRIGSLTRRGDAKAKAKERATESHNHWHQSGNWGHLGTAKALMLFRSMCVVRRVVGARGFAAAAKDGLNVSLPVGSPALAPFHHAFPVHNLAMARAFYGGVLGLQEGRSSDKWIDYNCFGHQIVAHLVRSDYRCQDYFNPV